MDFEAIKRRLIEGTNNCPEYKILKKVERRNMIIIRVATILAEDRITEYALFYNPNNGTILSECTSLDLNPYDQDFEFSISIMTSSAD